MAFVHAEDSSRNCWIKSLPLVERKIVQSSSTSRFLTLRKFISTSLDYCGFCRFISIGKTSCSLLLCFCFFTSVLFRCNVPFVTLNCRARSRNRNSAATRDSKLRASSQVPELKLHLQLIDNRFNGSLKLFRRGVTRE